jgi:hypothetical protein
MYEPTKTLQYNFIVAAAIQISPLLHHGVDLFITSSHQHVYTCFLCAASSASYPFSSIFSSCKLSTNTARLPEICYTTREINKPTTAQIQNTNTHTISLSTIAELAAPSSLPRFFLYPGENEYTQHTQSQSCLSNSQIFHF